MSLSINLRNIGPPDSDAMTIILPLRGKVAVFFTANETAVINCRDLLTSLKYEAVEQEAALPLS